MSKPNYVGKVAVDWLTDPDYDRLLWAIAEWPHHRLHDRRRDEQLARRIAGALILAADRAAEGEEDEPEDIEP